MSQNKLKCTFNVPVTYDGKRPVEPEFIDALERCLDRQFEGYTDEGKKRGSWRGQVEISQWYKVYVFPQDLPILRQIINEIGIKFEQKEMALEISADAAELLTVDATVLEGKSSQIIEWPEV